MKNLNLCTDIESFVIIEKISEGYSGDNKYKVQKDGKYFLLRVGDLAKATEKEAEFNQLMLYADKEINTQKPITFGRTSDKFYSIVTWVDGTPIMDIIKKDDSLDYYQLGHNVGVELKKLHCASRIVDKSDWINIIEKRATSFLEKFHSLNIEEFVCSRYAEQYILKNMSLMAGRPQVILHGDFHWNNCVVDENDSVGIIDFSGNNIGDPWYEFGGLLWALEYSYSFANGQIDGYFGNPPFEFWKVFKFYVALYAFEHLSFTNGTLEDIECRIFNATRMLTLFGETFELDIPLFREEVKKSVVRPAKGN